VDNRTTAERIGEGCGYMTTIVSMLIAVGGAALYAAVATLTNRDEGWIVWCGFGLLLVVIGLLECLVYAGEKIGALNGSPKSGIARGAMTMVIGTLLWSLSRVVPSRSRIILRELVGFSRSAARFL
jgi:hypothetical protein